MRKILIHSLIFSPDGVSTAYLYNDIALRFKKEGYDVVVLTTTPHYNVLQEQLLKQPLKWKVWGVFKESTFNGIRVYHIPQKKFKNTLLRLIGFVYWHIIAFMLGLSIKNIDVILSPSPPLTIGVINLWLSKIKGCKVVYNVQEIYPDILRKKEGFIFNFLRKMERYVYNSSDAVTTIDKVFYDTIVERFDDRKRLHIIPNFVDTDLYKPGASQDKLDRSIFPLNNNIKLLYAGNIGFAQDWEPLVQLAIKTRLYPIEYFVIGEGVMKGYLEDAIVKNGLCKVHVLPYQPRESIPSIIEYSDLQFIFMNPEMDKQGFPSKVYTIMACAKPLLVCSSEGTPIVNFLRQYNCSKVVTETDMELKVEEMYRWLIQVTKQELIHLGNNGLDVIRSTYTKEIVTKQYVDLIEELR